MLELKIALRYLFSKKTHNAVNVISMISVAGIAVASMAIVIVLSVFNGFERLAMKQISAIAPQLKVVPIEGKVIANADSLSTLLERRLPEAAVIPTLTDQGLAVVGDMQMPVTIKGVPQKWADAAGITSSVIDGAVMETDSAVSFADLSVGVAVKLKAHPGAYEYLRLYVPRRRGRINPANPYAAFRGDSLVVASVFQTGHADDDEHAVIVPLEVSRRLLDYADGEASAIEVWVPGDGVSKSDVIDAVEALCQGKLAVFDRMEQHRSTFAMISVEKWITFLMLTFIMVIASFNIISTLSLLMIENRGNMSIMLAMGATRSTITRVFLIEGWLVTIIGGVAGVIAGVALTLAQQWGGFVKLGGDPARMLVDAYPVELRLGDVLIVLALVVVVGFVTSLFTIAMSRGSAFCPESRNK